MKKIIFLYLVTIALTMPGKVVASNSDSQIVAAEEKLDSEALYEKGKQAVAAEEFEKAISYFAQANKTGYDNAKLHHAWAAALYKIGRYDEAGVHFEKARFDPSFAQLASLNLGLIAVKQNRNKDALSWFLEARDNGDSVKIRKLADTMLQRLNYSVSDPSPEENTILFISAQAGYESNGYSAALDEISGSDSFMEFNVYGARRMSGNDDEGINGSINAFTKLNNKSDATEVSVFPVQLGYYKHYSQLQFAAGAGVLPVYVGGDPYTTAITGEARLRYKMKKSVTLNGALGYEYANAESSDVSYAEGRLWRTRFQVKHSEGKHTTYFTIQNERHDRKDRTVGSDFYSYSPTRDSLEVRHRRPVSQQWELTGRLRFRHSRYEDSNQLSGVVRRRVENQYIAGLSMGYALSQHGKLLLGLEHTYNDSNWERYTYKRTEFTAGFQWLFF